MLRRNLIYTAITRSKQFLILCGEEDALRTGVRRADEQMRQTTLMEKLSGFTSIESAESVGIEEEQEEIPYEEFLMNVDPMVGMDGVTPYLFM